MVAESALAVVIAYLLGSIPFAYIAGRLVKGVDIRKLGGGNLGAINTLREVGMAAGFAVLFADIAKGALAVLIAQWFGLSPVVIFICGFAAVVGHSWPVFLRFNGGKGAATTIGVFAAIIPVEFAISFAVMLAVGFITSNSRLSMGIGFLLLPFIIWGFGGPAGLIIYSVALPVFVGLRFIPDARKEIARPGGRKNLIIDREHTWWQRKKK